MGKIRSRDGQPTTGNLLRLLGTGASGMILMALGEGSLRDSVLDGPNGGLEVNGDEALIDDCLRNLHASLWRNGNGNGSAPAAAEAVAGGGDGA